MSIPWYKDAVWEWVDAALSGLTVVFADQAAPMPSRPYATVQALTNVPREGGSPEFKATDEPIGDRWEYQLRYHRLVTVSVSIYADDAEDQAQLLEDSIFDPDTAELIDSLGIVVQRNIGGGENNFLYRQVGVDKFVVVDFEVAFSEVRTGQVDSIDSVVVTPDIK